MPIFSRRISNPLYAWQWQVPNYVEISRVTAVVGESQASCGLRGLPLMLSVSDWLAFIRMWQPS